MYKRAAGSSRYQSCKSFKRLYARHGFFNNMINFTMSSAFVKEEEEQWLHEVMPTLNALTYYLTRENNGVRVYERSNFVDAKTGKTVHVMSNGGHYSIDDESKWRMV